jgi:hypothetical protein
MRITRRDANTFNRRETQTAALLPLSRVPRSQLTLAVIDCPSRDEFERHGNHDVQIALVIVLAIPGA